MAQFWRGVDLWDFWFRERRGQEEEERGEEEERKRKGTGRGQVRFLSQGLVFEGWGLKVWGLRF